MNIVVICGKVISEVDFNFIYDRYRGVSSEKEKSSLEMYMHTSVAKCEIKLSNKSFIEIQGYDDVADFMYRYLKEKDTVWVEGRLGKNGNVIVESLLKTI